MELLRCKLAMVLIHYISLPFNYLMLGSTLVRLQWVLRCMATQNTFTLKVRVIKIALIASFFIQICKFLFPVPAPLALVLTSDPSSPVRPVGVANVTMTCTVELSPVVDVPVTVNIQLSDPAGRTLTTTTPAVSGSTHTTTAMISSFGRSQSGIYACKVNTSTTLTPSFITDGKTRFEIFRITAGKLIALNDKYS